MLHPDVEASAAGYVGPGIKINDQRSCNNFDNNNAGLFEKDPKMYATVSLESFHDTIHGLIGTGNKTRHGHMGNARYAGVSEMACAASF